MKKLIVFLSLALSVTAWAADPYTSSKTGAQIDAGVTAGSAAAAVNGIVKSNGSGTFSAQAVGTGAGDVAAGNHNHTGVYSAADHNHTGTYQPADADLTSIAGGVTGIVKGAGNGGGYSAASAGTDYVAPDADLTSIAGGVTGIVKGAGNGNGYSAAAASDVVGLFGTGSCSGYLKSDGSCDAGSGGYTNLTQFLTQTAWRVFYSDGSGDVKELALGSDGEYLKSNGASSAPSWATPSGAAHDAVTLGAGIGGLTLSTQVLGLSARLEAYHDYADPNADRLWGWDDSAGAFTGFSLGTGLAFGDATLNLDATIAALTSLTITQGSLLYGTGADAFAVLAKGTAGQILWMNSGATAPEWTSTLSGLTFDLGTPSIGANEIVTVDADGKLQMSGIVWPSGLDATELGYVNGVTSAIQTQLDAKVAKATYNAHTILYATTDDTPAALTVGEQTVVGRVTSGNIAALTLGVAAGNVMQAPADPAAHTVFGFDNTTNTYKNFTIGSGLAFDQATATLSSTGSMTYPGAGIPQSTGSAWGTSITAGTGVVTALGVNVGSAGAFVTNGGALGTPSSATLTNATGLPVAGVTASTSTPLGVGSIELGHASDTSITRVSAGVAAVEGLTLPRIVASGTLSAHDEGSLSSGACSSAIDGGTATGVATTDRIVWNFNGDPTGITGFAASASGGLFIYAYPTTDHVNFKICNNTAGAVNAGAITLNWMVLR